MRVLYKTNVDCVKRYMAGFGNQSTYTIPNVGDDICVVDEPRKCVLLKVCKRTFFKDRVEIEVNLTDPWATRGYFEFEKFVQSPE